MAYFLVDLPKDKSGADITPTACRAAARNLIELGFDVFLAGGLTAESVNAAISEVSPFAVDVASGIEDKPGHKDPFKTRTFIAEATR